MKTKEVPLLADQIIAASPSNFVRPGTKINGKALQARIRRAERMVFDHEASQRVAQVVHEIPELLVEQIQFARPPFDITWIEYQFDTFWETVMDTATDKNDLTRDKTIGLLIDHNRVNVFGTSFSGHIYVLPFAYHLNTEWPLQDQIRFAEVLKISRMQIDLWLWGQPANKFMAEGKHEYLRGLRNTTMVETLFEHDNVRNPINLLNTTNGDFKNVIALLLMLNQPKVTNYIRVPPRRGWVGNKPRGLLSHNNVIVSLDAKQQTILLSEGKGVGGLRRKHDVRGHFCQNQIARDYARIAGCIHEWQPMTEEWEPWPDAPLDQRQHWQCKTCDGKRWWRSAHERGTRQEGQIEHTYKVTTS